MLYDENGKPHIEPVLLPEEQHLFYIVKDYQRMFIEYHRMKKREREHLEKLNELNKKNNALRSRVNVMIDVIRHCVRHMKKHDVMPSTFLVDFLRQNLIHLKKED